MMQYKNIFGTYREPRVGLDKLFFARDSQHIVVASQGNFYKVIVYSERIPLRTEQILEQLIKVDKDSHERGRGSQVGHLMPMFQAS